MPRGWHLLVTGGNAVKETFLTIEEAAQVLRISPRSAYTLAREGRLEGAVKVGNQWRVNRDALMAWSNQKDQTAKASLSPEGEVKP
jgi:excisionase family DNA binding protein